MNKYEYINNYQKEHYDRVSVLLVKGKKDGLRYAAKQEGLTLSELCVKAMRIGFRALYGDPII